MGKQIKFTSNVDFMGRNGMFTATGIDILHCKYGEGDDAVDKVMICPITTKGHIANCEIQIPTFDIPKFIEALQKEIKLKS